MRIRRVGKAKRAHHLPTTMHHVGTARSAPLPTLISAPLTLCWNRRADLPGFETRRVSSPENYNIRWGVGMLTFGILGAAFGVLFFGSLFSGDR